MLGRFELIQEMDTSDARDREAFERNATTYLAVANYQDAGNYNIKSQIYRYSSARDQFEVMQELDTSGAFGVKAFTLDNAAHLAVANFYDGSTFNLKLRLYRHSLMSGRFELVQDVGTSGAADWETFVLNGTTHLVVANFWNGKTQNVKSRIYRNSVMSSRFEVVQEVYTTGPTQWKAFAVEGATYLVVANSYDGTTFNIKSHIYRYSPKTARFELVQAVDTSGAYDWKAFTVDGANNLAVANHLDDISYKPKFRIHRFSAASDRFELVQEVAMVGALAWEAFTLNGAAVASWYNGSSYNSKSSIYHFGVPC